MKPAKASFDNILPGFVGSLDFLDADGGNIQVKLFFNTRDRSEAERMFRCQKRLLTLKGIRIDYENLEKAELRIKK